MKTIALSIVMIVAFSAAASGQVEKAPDKKGKKEIEASDGTGNRVVIRSDSLDPAKTDIKTEDGRIRVHAESKSGRVDVDQEGAGNRTEIDMQGSDSAGNRVRIHQSGSGNKSTVIQRSGKDKDKGKKDKGKKEEDKWLIDGGDWSKFSEKTRILFPAYLYKILDMNPINPLI